MWRSAVLGAIVATALRSGAAAATNRPFGSHPMPYAAGAVGPSHVGQGAFDQRVRDAYDAWKAAYVRQDCDPGRYVVLAATQSGSLTVSEAHGYGMILAALMAGHDPEARRVFDGLYAYFRDHPSVLTPNLMAWYQKKSCASAEGADSASDGDLDVALALLLADRQWGSSAPSTTSPRRSRCSPTSRRPSSTRAAANGVDSARDLRVKANGKRMTVPGPVVGPLRVTAVLGASSAAGGRGVCDLAAARLHGAGHEAALRVSARRLPHEPSVRVEQPDLRRVHA
jgi:hypothetical protein